MNKKNMIDNITYALTESQSVTETINQENIELNAKILAALLSPSISKIANKDVLAAHGIKWQGLGPNIELIGPNGRKIGHTGNTAYQQSERIWGVGAPDAKWSWHGGEVTNRARFNKIDFITLLTSPDMAEHGAPPRTYKTSLVDFGPEHNTLVYKEDPLAKNVGQRQNYRHYRATRPDKDNNLDSHVYHNFKMKQIIQNAEKRTGLKVNPDGKPRISKAK